MIEDIKKMYLNNCKKSEILKKYNLNYHELNKILNNLNILKIKNYKNKIKLNEKYLDKIDSEEKAYFLGFVLADGFINTDGKTIGISIHKKDKDILEKIKSSIEYEGEIKEYISTSGFSKKTEYCKLKFNSSNIYNKLINFGINSKKSYNYKLNLNLIPKIFHKDFIRGYFDGDCSIIKSNKRNKIIYSISFLGLNCILDFFENHFNIEKKYYRDKRKENCETYAIKIEKQSLVENILDEIYKDSKIHLNRKYNIYKEFKKTKK